MYSPSEEERVGALRELRILDTPPEDRFDRIVRLAQRLFDVPAAQINLIDRDRQWTKATVGRKPGKGPRIGGGHAHVPTASRVPSAISGPRRRCGVVGARNNGGSGKAAD